MENKLKTLLDKLIKTHSLELNEYEYILDNRSDEVFDFISSKARELANFYYKNNIFLRGLIEISNICTKDCYYCGIRKSNKKCSRYRLNKEDILTCCDEGYKLGFRTFVLQGGEDPYFDDKRLCDIIKSIKEKYPSCAITLSLGEKSKESYKALFDAGADRYLLRHETANEQHYKKLHPINQTLTDRIKSLKALKEIGFQVGCGFMVGSPFQSNKTLAQDLKFIEIFKPDMCGVGPFIPHKDTPFKDYSAGDIKLTLFLLSLIRIIYPPVLLPATTALGTLDEFGREKAIYAGANIIMPNLSPKEVRKKYMLYDNKKSDGDEAAESKDSLEKRINNIGYNVLVSRGDINKKIF